MQCCRFPVEKTSSPLDSTPTDHCFRIKSTINICLLLRRLWSVPCSLQFPPPTRHPSPYPHTHTSLSLSLFWRLSLRLRSPPYHGRLTTALLGLTSTAICTIAFPLLLDCVDLILIIFREFASNFVIFLLLLGIRLPSFCHFCSPCFVLYSSCRLTYSIYFSSYISFISFCVTV